MGGDQPGVEAVSALEAVAARLARREPLSAEDGQAILATNDIIEIGVLADGVRRERHGAQTTFVRVFEMHVDAPAPALPSGASAGEVRIVGTPRDVETAVAAVRAAALAADGRAPVAGFALSDIVKLAGGTGSLGPLCARLRDAGLQALADVPVDALDNAPAAVEAARRAGLAALRLTVHTLDPSDRFAVVERARALQHAVGGFRAFAPLPRSVPVDLPTTGYDDVKLIGLARLLVDNVASIQVDWPLYGPKLAQVALTAGADDVDGVAAVDPGTLGSRRSVMEEITRNIRAAALEPAERDGLFGAR